MITLLTILIFVALGIFACVRNFLVQVVAMKFVMDGVFLFLVLFNQKKFVLANIAWFFMSIGMSLIFLTFVVSVRRLSGRRDLDFSGDEL